MGRLFRLFIIFVQFQIGLAPILGYGADMPESHFDFWQKNYKPLSEIDDPRAAKAHKIFQRILLAAGSKPGVIPRLYILKTSKFAKNGPAFAIPDGGIIISKEVLDICYKVPELGDDRLAFILAHEIAHQFKDDFWHLKFFQALEISNKIKTDDEETLAEIKTIAKSSDKVLAKELQADEYGIIYAAMAGFNVVSIVNHNTSVNFFEDFYAALDLTNISGISQDEAHPTPNQRAQVVLTRLAQVVENLEAFYLGVNLYQAGKFSEAAKAFESFAGLFPSREVYHNIATCYHQLALQAFKNIDAMINTFPFKLTFTAVNETRAAGIILRGAFSPEKEFSDNIAKAIQYYKKAISIDPVFVTAYINLGCAYLLNNEYYKAVGVLQDAEKLDPKEKGLQNNLGVAYFMVENLAKAKKTFQNLYTANRKNSEVLYNLGFIAIAEGDQEAAHKYFEEYIGLDNDSFWASRIFNTIGIEKEIKHPNMIPNLPKESVDGIEPGSFEDEVPQEWGKPLFVKNVNSADLPYLVKLYGNGIKTVSQDDEIILIVFDEHFTGKTTKGLKIKSTSQDIRQHYNNPSAIYDFAYGQTYIYPKVGISFHLRDGQVVGWLLFQS